MLFRFHIDFLALRKERGFFGEIYKVEFNFAHKVLILDAEKEPLVVAPGVGVHPHVQIELFILRLNLNSHIQVPRFKIWVKL